MKKNEHPTSILFYSFNYTLNHRLRYLSYRANVRNTITDTSEEYQSNYVGRAVVYFFFFFFFSIDSFIYFVFFFLFPVELRRQSKINLYIIP